MLSPVTIASTRCEYASGAASRARTASRSRTAKSTSSSASDGFASSRSSFAAMGSTRVSTIAPPRWATASSNRASDAAADPDDRPSGGHSVVGARTAPRGPGGLTGSLEVGPSGWTARNQRTRSDDMPTNRKLLGAAAFSLALAGGGVAGALLGTPSPSGAQDGTERRPRHHGRRRRRRRASARTGASRSRPPPRPSASPRTSSARPSRTASRSPRWPRPRASTCRS